MFGKVLLFQEVLPANVALKIMESFWDVATDQHDCTSSHSVFNAHHFDVDHVSLSCEVLLLPSIDAQPASGFSGVSRLFQALKIFQLQFQRVRRRAAIL